MTIGFDSMRSAFASSVSSADRSPSNNVEIDEPRDGRNHGGRLNRLVSNLESGNPVTGEMYPGPRMHAHFPTAALDIPLRGDRIHLVERRHGQGE